MKLIIMIAGLVLTSQAYATDFEFGYGQTTFSKQDNGIWWQSPFQNQFDLKHVSYNIGVSTYVSPSIRMRFGYQNLGGVTSSALATTDLDYATQLCNGPCWPLIHFNGVSNVSGLYMTADPEMSLGAIKLFMEGGALYSRTQFIMTLPNYRACRTCVPHMYQVQAIQRYTLSPVVGFGIRYRNVEIALNYLRLVGGSDYPPNFGKNTTNLSIRYTF